MELHTTSEVINLCKTLENQSAMFYESLSDKYPEHKDLFLSFAKDNKNNIKQIERAYYSVITDAIEGCFAFNMESDDYTLETFTGNTGNNGTCHEAVLHAIQMEETIIKFYSFAAEQSSSLMADIPRAFRLVLKKRDGRKAKLRSLFS